MGDLISDIEKVPGLAEGIESTVASMFLIPGNADKLSALITGLQKIGSAMVQAGDGMANLDTKSHWTGDAADQFRSVFHEQPANWRKGQALNQAATALAAYRDTMVWAKAETKAAAEQYIKGAKASRAAVDQYNAAVDAANSGTGAPPAPFVDPGKADCQDAMQRYQAARQRLESAAAAAASAVAGCSGQLPEIPDWFTKFSADTADELSLNGTEFLDMADGAISSVKGMFELYRATTPFDYYNLTHPIQFAQNMASLGGGIIGLVTHPESAIPAMVKSAIDLPDWQNGHQARAIGSLIPNVALAAMTDGAGGAARGLASAATGGLTDVAEVTAVAARGLGKGIANASRKAAGAFNDAGDALNAAAGRAGEKIFGDGSGLAPAGAAAHGGSFAASSSGSGSIFDRLSGGSGGDTPVPASSPIPGPGPSITERLGGPGQADPAAPKPTSDAPAHSPASPGPSSLSNRLDGLDPRFPAPPAQPIPHDTPPAEPVSRPTEVPPTNPVHSGPTPPIAHEQHTGQYGGDSSTSSAPHSPAHDPGIHNPSPTNQFELPPGYSTKIPHNAPTVYFHNPGDNPIPHSFNDGKAVWHYSDTPGDSNNSVYVATNKSPSDIAQQGGLFVNPSDDGIWLTVRDPDGAITAYKDPQKAADSLGDSGPAAVAGGHRVETSYVYRLEPPAYIDQEYSMGNAGLDSSNLQGRALIPHGVARSDFINGYEVTSIFDSDGKLVDRVIGSQVRIPRA